MVITARRARVDALSKLELAFELADATTIQPGKTAVVSLSGTHSLSKTLRQLGYSDIDDRSGIAVWANDNAGNRLRGTLRSCTFQPPAEIVQIDVAQIDEGFGNIATITLSTPCSNPAIPTA